MARSRKTKPIALAIDIGSSSTRSALFNSTGAIIPKTAASEHYSIHYGPDGAAELSPLVLWRAVNRCVTTTVERRNRSRVTAVSISSFWHGLLGLDSKWRPLTPVYTWADSRAAEAARELRNHLNERRVHALTGCRIHSSYWPAKLRWIKTESPALFGKVALWVSPADWILHRLFATTHTTPSMASGTGLLDLQRFEWSGEICRVAAVSQKTLPSIESTPVITSSRRLGLSSVAIMVIGDGAASNLGSGASANGVVAINVGTSAALRVIVPAKRRRLAFGLFRYVLDGKRFVIGGAVSNAGNLREWALRELRIPTSRNGQRKTLSRTAAAGDSLVVLPFWVDERAPTWPDDGHGVVYGLNPSVTATEIARSLATATFYRLGEILKILRTSGSPTRRIIVSGGILRSTAEIRILADAIGRDVEISPVREASLRGAAIFALEQQRIPSPALRKGRIVKHSRALAAVHAQRRAKQKTLEKRLTASL